MDENVGPKSRHKEAKEGQCWGFWQGNCRVGGLGLELTIVLAFVMVLTVDGYTCGWIYLWLTRAYKKNKNAEAAAQSFQAAATISYL